MATNKERIQKYRFSGTGLTGTQKRWAQSRFKQYRVNYHIEAFSDLQLLEELVFRETLQEQNKEVVEDFSKKNDTKENAAVASLVSAKALKLLNENLEQILILKDKLGLFDKEKEDEYKAFEILEKKFTVYREEHSEEFKTTCPFCSEIFFLNRRTENFKPSKLKLYKNKVLCNEYLWKIYKEGKITKIDLSLIFNVSESYIDWLEEGIYRSAK